MKTESRKQSFQHVALMGLFGAAVIVASGSHAFGEPPSAAEREKFHQAVQTCHQETGVAKPEKGNPPSEDARKKMEACLTAKGFTKPPHPPGPHGEGRPPGPPPPPPNEDSNS